MSVFVSSDAWPRRFARTAAVVVAGLVLSPGEAALHSAETFRPQIPRVWDAEALRDLELPLAASGVPPEHVSPEYYYAQKVRPIYASYPVYHPDREPAGYFEGLKSVEPVVLWGEQEARPKLESEADWVRAGELVFDSPLGFQEMTPAARESRATEMRTLPYRVTANGEVPFYRYVVREKGKIELGTLSCAECHTRVMPDGNIIKGAQGNLPFDRQFACAIRTAPAAEMRSLQRLLFAAPWLNQPIISVVDSLSSDQIAAFHDSIPPGVLARHGSGAYSPVQIPDLIGVTERRYLDHTGLQRNRGLGDLMRYAALNQGADLLSTFSGFIPDSDDAGKGRPDPKTRFRYSDEQLYALVLYLKNLRPPPNPNPLTELAQRGKAIFQEQECSRCHDPKQGYTNNKLAVAPGYTVPERHPARADIMKRQVETDSALALQTRRGTGLYKVPSLRGVWYRGFFEHNGSCATLEDWFDPRRLDDNYVPTGWKGPLGTTTRPVKGHEFGLDLDATERAALIACLRTL